MASSISTSMAQSTPPLGAEQLKQLKVSLSLSAPPNASVYLQPNHCPRTPLIKEERANKFRYWQNGQLHTGLTFSGELFYAVVQFDLHSYVEGIKVADDLRSSGILSIITASDRMLTVWVSMRSQAVPDESNA